MSYKDYSARVEFIGCRYDEAFKAKINDMISSMEKNPAPYRGSFELEVTRTGDTISTATKNSEGLNEDEKRMLDALEEMAHAVSKKGGEPNKVKTEVEVEREI